VILFISTEQKLTRRWRDGQVKLLDDRGPVVGIGHRQGSLTTRQCRIQLTAPRQTAGPLVQSVIRAGDVVGEHVGFTPFQPLHQIVLRRHIDRAHGLHHRILLAILSTGIFQTEELREDILHGYTVEEVMRQFLEDSVLEVRRQQVSGRLRIRHFFLHLSRAHAVDDRVDGLPDHFRILVDICDGLGGDAG